MSRTEEPNEREKKVFGKMKQKAAKIVNDNQRLKEVLHKTKEKMDLTDKDDSLKSKLVEYVSLLVRMVSNTVKGVYPDTPWQTLIMFVAGLLYFLTPIDAIPDFIPVAGLIDDTTILVWLGKCFQKDLQNYKKWEDSNVSK